MTIVRGWRHCQLGGVVNQNNVEVCELSGWAHTLLVEPFRRLHCLQGQRIAESSTPGGSPTCSEFL